MARNSNERAEVIAQAAFPSCSAERQAVFDVFKRHKRPFSLEAMNAAEGEFSKNLLLEVIKARAKPVTSPVTPPASLESPPAKRERLI
jgi:hypothetical protein